MHPVLLKIGSVPIHTYGVMIAIGFILALVLAKRLGRQSGIDGEKLVDLGFWVLLAGFFGARALFVLTRLDYFLEEPMAIFRVWEGGLVFYGGVIAAFFVAIVFLRKHQLPIWKSGDIVVIGLALAHGFGRLGCLSSGCCFGRPTDSDWGLVFYTGLVDMQFHGIPLHPTQIYSSVSLFILAGGLLYLHKKKVFDGQVTLTYFMVYPVIRSVIEVFRGDLVRGFVIEGILSTSQFISVLVFLVAAGFLFFRLKQVRQGST